MNRLWLSVPEAFAFQSECGVGAVPVIAEELRKTVVVQVNLKFVHLVEGKYLYVLFQIIHCKEFAGHIQHKAAVRESG